MTELRSWAAAALVVAAVFGWWGWPAACVAAAVALLTVPGAPVPVPLSAAGSWLSGRMRRLAVAFGAWPTRDRISMTLTAVGVVATAAGVALAAGAGYGVLAAGIACGAIGLRLERAG